MEKNISVIIPTYKGAEYIARAVKSALNQNIKNLEIIVVDDNGLNSAEQRRTQAVLKESGLIKKVKYIILEKNQGGAVARNRGADQATGEYFVFIDDDDELGDGQLLNEAEALNELSQDYAGCFCGCNVIKDGKVVNHVNAKMIEPFLVNYLERNIWIGTGSVMLRQEIFYAINGYDERYERHQDMEFYSRLLDKYKMKGVNNCAFIRYHTFRNYTTDLSKAKKYFDFYINGLRANVTSISTEELERIIVSEYISFASRYIRVKDWKGFFSIIRNYCGGIKCLPVMIKKYLKSLVKILSGDRFR